MNKLSQIYSSLYILRIYYLDINYYNFMKTQLMHYLLLLNQFINISNYNFFTQMFPKDKLNESNCTIINGICKNHLFELKNIDRQTKPLPSTNLFYCPVFSQRHQQYQNIFPQFNNDHKYFSAAFVLEIDQLFNQQNQSFQKDRFDRVVQQRKNKRQNYNFDPPFKSNQFCNVCTTKYEDYFEHINDFSHKSNIRKSVANSYIQTLCQFYKQEYQLKRTRNNQGKQTSSKMNRTSARLRQFEQKKKEKQQSICQISTMTTQKQVKGEEQQSGDRKIKTYKRKIIQKQERAKLKCKY